MKKIDAEKYEWEYVRYDKRGRRLLPVMRNGKIEKTFIMPKEAERKDKSII